MSEFRMKAIYCKDADEGEAALTYIRSVYGETSFTGKYYSDQPHYVYYDSSEWRGENKHYTGWDRASYLSESAEVIDVEFRKVVTCAPVKTITLNGVKYTKAQALEKINAHFDN